MWFEKAAASGVPQAMLNLGKMLENVSERRPCSVSFSRCFFMPPVVRRFWMFTRSVATRTVDCVGWAGRTVSVRRSSQHGVVVMSADLDAIIMYLVKAAEKRELARN